MKKEIAAAAVAVALGMITGSAPALAENSIGANPDGTEKVCSLGMGAQSEQGFAEALQRCKRGDILDIGWAKSTLAIQVCDFTKSIVYHPGNGAIIACVYTGNRRAVSK